MKLPQVQSGNCILRRHEINQRNLVCWFILTEAKVAELLDVAYFTIHKSFFPKIEFRILKRKTMYSFLTMVVLNNCSNDYAIWKCTARPWLASKNSEASSRTLRLLRALLRETRNNFILPLRVIPTEYGRKFILNDARRWLACRKFPRYDSIQSFMKNTCFILLHDKPFMLLIAYKEVGQISATFSKNLKIFKCCLPFLPLRC